MFKKKQNLTIDRKKRSSVKEHQKALVESVIKEVIVLGTPGALHFKKIEGVTGQFYIAKWGENYWGFLVMPFTPLQSFRLGDIDSLKLPEFKNFKINEISKDMKILLSPVSVKKLSSYYFRAMKKKQVIEKFVKIIEALMQEKNSQKPVSHQRTIRMLSCPEFKVITPSVQSLQKILSGNQGSYSRFYRNIIFSFQPLTLAEQEQVLVNFLNFIGEKKSINSQGKKLPVNKILRSHIETFISNIKNENRRHCVQTFLCGLLDPDCSKYNMTVDTCLSIINTHKNFPEKAPILSTLIDINNKIHSVQSSSTFNEQYPKQYLHSSLFEVELLAFLRHARHCQIKKISDIEEKFIDQYLDKYGESSEKKRELKFLLKGFLRWESRLENEVLDIKQSLLSLDGCISDISRSIPDKKASNVSRLLTNFSEIEKTDYQNNPKKCCDNDIEKYLVSKLPKKKEQTFEEFLNENVAFFPPEPVEILMPPSLFFRENLYNSDNTFPKTLLFDLVVAAFPDINGDLIKRYCKDSIIKIAKLPEIFNNIPSLPVEKYMEMLYLLVEEYFYVTKNIDILTVTPEQKKIFSNFLSSTALPKIKEAIENKIFENEDNDSVFRLAELLNAILVQEEKNSPSQAQFVKFH